MTFRECTNKCERCHRKPFWKGGMPNYEVQNTTTVSPQACDGNCAQPSNVRICSFVVKKVKDVRHYFNSLVYCEEDNTTYWVDNEGNPFATYRQPNFKDNFDPTKQSYPMSEVFDLANGKLYVYDKAGKYHEIGLVGPKGEQGPKGDKGDSVDLSKLELKKISINDGGVFLPGEVTFLAAGRAPMDLSEIAIDTNGSKNTIAAMYNCSCVLTSFGNKKEENGKYKYRVNAVIKYNDNTEQKIPFSYSIDPMDNSIVCTCSFVESITKDAKITVRFEVGDTGYEIHDFRLKNILLESSDYTFAESEINTPSVHKKDPAHPANGLNSDKEKPNDKQGGGQ